MRKILLLLIIAAALAVFFVGINSISKDYYNLNEGNCGKRYSKKEYVSIIKSNLVDFSLETSTLSTANSIVEADRVVAELMEHIDYIMCIHGEERLDRLEQLINDDLSNYKVIFKEYFESRTSDDRGRQEIYFRQLEELGKRLDQHILDYENEITLD